MCSVICSLAGNPLGPNSSILQLLTNNPLATPNSSNKGNLALVTQKLMSTIQSPVIPNVMLHIDEAAVEGSVTSTTDNHWPLNTVLIELLDQNHGKECCLEDGLAVLGPCNELGNYTAITLMDSGKDKILNAQEIYNHFT